MNKLILKSRFLITLSIILGLLFVVSCEKEEAFNNEIEAVDTTQASERSFPLPDRPDFTPPNIPQPPRYDAHCVVRLSYLSYLRRCPENAGVVNYWINVLNTQGFDDLAKGFITSNEASVKWSSQYHSYLSRNNLNSVEVHKFIYIAYRGLLLREPDVNGGRYWTNIFYDNGIRAVANGIGNSQEFRNRLNNIQTECTNAANQCTY
ncbi:DUF4214 domain-containing protein [Aquimarina sp. 2201CG5-10]|uniref:DUF4214 domain-containing protein n=1 Tax=Aquimarina callyspongiae TaxID=3098150 RepID=UPI002AB52C46|nr:DUF4214 domain-containing protein [Aquimarina sp. 2201CG5-10]MDY8137814.1 DUF4214 domain-containing protein [Aquimarina sp. 2201CG5-10]